ncbi:MAG: acetyl-CoA C-acetyltransferase [Candidatus Latescibacterota bacterium]|jgi:acetyl-CoA C-acetyltransferase|nr:MAG: acetyl-CoA C-acetyltransferase [Candidatus Latescibacterota bacterium]
MKEVVIAGAVRTPLGKFLGGLTPFGATQLGAMVVKETLRRSGVPGDRVDEVIMGNVVSAGLGQNPARQAAIYGGVAETAGALTINKVCGSGLKAVVLGAQAIKLGDAEIVVAGGMESMSNAPYILRQARTGYRLNDGAIVDTMVFDGLWDIYNNYHMGNTAELVSEKYGVSRGEMDEYSYHSHRKAVEAHEKGYFREEMLTVEIPQKKGDPVRIDRDEGPRPDSSVEGMAKLKPVFKKDGTITAANASQISDGAAAMTLMSDAKAKELGVKPIARVTGYATGGMKPEWVMMAPTVAIPKLLAKLGASIDDFDAIELNEAFAVQPCAVMKELKMNPAKVNRHGGAVALGHPIGCSGARILVTLLHVLKRTGGKRGLASLCLGGGNAVALSVEMI